MCAGAATTAVYPSIGGEDVAFILSDSGARVVVSTRGYGMTCGQLSAAAGCKLRREKR